MCPSFGFEVLVTKKGCCFLARVVEIPKFQRVSCHMYFGLLTAAETKVLSLSGFAARMVKPLPRRYGMQLRGGERRMCCDCKFAPSPTKNQNTSGGHEDE
ncbi:hypothetical protein E1A91_A07G107800v1 [Gossypium mustelinum]|uniref:Uncharacterized protein n=1 Tax=Gossypium mustelinum TaxID=34275 RepID=A0A5D2YJ27_GOSMU|nr:hypothetical protein E1A91_A07G107800v1 [Gossypium mustelinum]